MDIISISILLTLIILLIPSIIVLISLIINKDKSKLKLSDNQRETHRYLKRTFYIQLLTLILTGLLIISGISYNRQSLDTQIKLAEEQINFLKKVSSNNWAYLEIDFRYPPKDRFIVSVDTLTNPGEKYPISLVVVNSGKVDSGNVWIESILNDKYLFAHLNPTRMNVSSQSGKYTDLFIRQSYCSKGSEYNCNSSKLPIGNYNLNLTFKCDFCAPEQRVFDRIIPLCIYHENIEECE